MGYEPKNKKSYKRTPQLNALSAFLSKKEQQKWALNSAQMKCIQDNSLPPSNDLSIYSFVRALLPAPPNSGMGDLEYSFRQYLDWIVSVSPYNFSIDPSIRLDAEHLTFADGDYDLMPGEVQWSQIDINKNPRCLPVKNAGLSAGLELLMLACQYPELILQMDGKDHLYWNLGGLNVLRSDVNILNCTPGLCAVGRNLMIGINTSSSCWISPDSWCTPELVK